MPLYEYQCDQCGARFEVIQKFSDDAVETCRSCGGTVRRLLSAPAIQFKGTGWYITDYARKGAGGSDKEKTSAASGESGAASAAPEAGKDASAAGSAPSTPAKPSTASATDKT